VKGRTDKIVEIVSGAAGRWSPRFCSPQPPRRNRPAQGGQSCSWYKSVLRSSLEDAAGRQAARFHSSVPQESRNWSARGPCRPSMVVN